MFSLGEFVKTPLREFSFMFTPGPKESNKKVLHETQKKTNLGMHWVEIQPYRLMLIFTPDPAKPSSLRLEMYSLGLFGKMPSREFSIMFFPGPKKIEKESAS